jgi:hypothetical protein
LFINFFSTAGAGATAVVVFLVVVQAIADNKTAVQIERFLKFIIKNLSAAKIKDLFVMIED